MQRSPTPPKSPKVIDPAGHENHRVLTSSGFFSSIFWWLYNLYNFFLRGFNPIPKSCKYLTAMLSRQKAAASMGCADSPACPERRRKESTNTGGQISQAIISEKKTQKTQKDSQKALPIAFALVVLLRLPSGNQT